MEEAPLALGKKCILANGVVVGENGNIISQIDKAQLAKEEISVGTREAQEMTEVLREFKCLRCSHIWKVPFGGGRQMACPECGTDKIQRTNPGIGGPWRKKGKGAHGRGHRP